MIIVCSKCNATYNIKASKIPAAGVTANCKKCGNKFRVNPSSTPKPMPAAPAPMPFSASIDASEKKMGLKPLTGLTKLLRVFLVINTIVCGIAIFGGLFEYHAYMDLPADVDLSETIIPAEIVTAIIGLIQLIVFIILGINFLRWIHRANKNLGVLSGQSMDFTPGWSVGWYFVPIANLFKPYQAMKEIWETSHKHRFGSSAILGLWWALWLISNFLGEFAFKAFMKAESVTDYGSSTLTYIVSDGIDVLLSIVAFMLVTQIGSAYAKNYGLQQSACTGGNSVAQRPSPPDRTVAPTVQAS